MKERETDKTKGTDLKTLSSDLKITLVSVQRKIQNLNSDSRNSSFLKELLQEASNLINTSNKDAAKKILHYSKEMDFYLEGGKDNLEKFYYCKGESLAIIAKQL